MCLPKKIANKKNGLKSPLFLLCTGWDLPSTLLLAVAHGRLSYRVSRQKTLKGQVTEDF